MKRLTLNHFRFVLLLVIGISSGSLLQGEQRRPNILFMFTDDQPQNCLGVMGNDHIQTPHLDQLARHGTLFNNAFATTAICCSNRACILTGQQMYRHGINDFKTPLSAAAFDQEAEIPDSPTLTREDWESQPEFIRHSLNGDGSRRWLENPDLYQRELRTFYRTVTRADAAVGTILAELKRLGLDDNTVVIFSSDHGSLLGDHGLSGKWLMYENSIRVPLIIYDPRVERDRAAKRPDELVLSIDLAPTMLDLAGVERPDSMQGRTVMPIVRNEPIEWRSHFYYQHTYNTNPPRSPIVVTEGVRTHRWKYIRYPETSPVFEQLFDMKTDPLERTDLASLAEHAVLLSELRTKCEQAPTLP